MLHKWIRLIKFDGTTYTDQSLLNQDPSATLPINQTAASYLYIGKHYPFNNLFFHLSAVNANESAMKVEYWSNNDWVNVVDLLDATSSGGKTLAKTGVVQFSPDKNKHWQSVDDTSAKGSTPTELRTFSIYHMYWIRISFTADLSSLAALNQIAYAFTSSAEVEAQDVTVKEYKASFGTGKTDWINEVMTASQFVITDLDRRGLVVSEGSVLRFDDVSLATAYKTLWLIFSQLGESFRQRAADCDAMYNKLISKSRYRFDQDDNALIDRGEVYGRAAVLVR